MLLRQTLLVVLAGQYLLAVVTAQSAPLEKRPAQEPLQVADRFVRCNMCMDALQPVHGSTATCTWMHASQQPCKTQHSSMLASVHWPMFSFTCRGLSTADIQVLVIASEARDDWRLQADTWLRHFPHYIATEKHTPKCKICGTPDNTPHKGSLFEGALFFGDRFHGRVSNLSCAG